jgi:hypothetical protein
LSNVSITLLAMRRSPCHIHLARTEPETRRIAMHDDYTSLAWAEQHQQVSTMIHKLFRKTAAVFIRLNALQFDAPWQHAAKRDKCR